ncbi:VPS10 domain-containing receptor SorCS3 [Paenibacillus jamilae]|uniref:VPS10 domain-containing receptor SorCS3 n=1 Tax=Paenibacillus jamilae TaxID=114136 RepID=A0ACC4ZT11_9BACL|nr:MULTISPECIES: YCF48-related protein [Paenibacillus]AUO08666.1 VPS10 domain-containing receptor SorCS3 [Paenibacillus sp. lzh-N1]KTS81000.1 VPS10 domain-containing receptor SorCS3 [Paenibacillus jamilae]
MKLRWRALLGGIMLLTGILLTACSAEPPKTVTKPSIEEPDDQGQTITINPPVTPKAGDPNAKYVVQTRIADFHLIDNNKGLVWGVTHNELRLYDTHDGGKTWNNISPSENVQFQDKLEYGKDISFTDSRHGWVVRQNLDQTATVILRTSDGGQSWDVSALPSGDHVSSIQYVNPTTGWIMAYIKLNEQDQQKMLYHTTDGGATWNKVAQSSGMTSNKSGSGLPDQGSVAGMSFSSNNQGFVAINVDSRVKLYKTSNLGKTWTPVANSMQGCPQAKAEAQQSLEGNSSSYWIPVLCYGDKGTKYNGLFTNNTGTQWNDVPLGLSSNNTSITPGRTFLSDKEGWVITVNGMSRTMDGGKTWTSLRGNKVLPSKLKDYPRSVKLRFASSSVGWLLLERLDDKKSLLLKTTDGGANWRIL